MKAGFPTSTLPKVDHIKPAADQNKAKKLMLSPSCYNDFEFGAKHASQKLINSEN